MEHLLSDITGLDLVLAVTLLALYLWRQSSARDPRGQE